LRENPAHGWEVLPAQSKGFIPVDFLVELE